jgi:limonene-1,2-epoxide hydrolase
VLDLNSGIWVRNMSFDPMAAAVDWLDAYRSGDLKTILRMYADDAVVECGCGGMKTITGKQGLRAYWQQRLKDYPASDLDDVRPAAEGALISYCASDTIIAAVLQFDANGQIALMRCAPSN